MVAIGNPETHKRSEGVADFDAIHVQSYVNELLDTDEKMDADRLVVAVQEKFPDVSKLKIPRYVINAMAARHTPSARRLPNL